ncbi:MAG: response regulator [Gammaproteobacteria bacterium]|nr:MAG: response regulator [Gammaproteobacteria bacterium]
MSSERATVLFVDDEERILRSLRMLFRGRYEVLTTTSGHEALKMLRERRVHVVVSDQRMPLMLGVDLLRQVREISPVTMRLLLTGYSDLSAIVASVNESEIFRFIEKPWQAPYLLDVVEQAIAGVDLARGSIDEGLFADLSGVLEDTVFGVDQIADLVASLKDFSRRDQVHAESVDVHRLIES